MKVGIDEYLSPTQWSWPVNADVARMHGERAAIWDAETKVIRSEMREGGSGKG